MIKTIKKAYQLIFDKKVDVCWYVNSQNNKVLYIPVLCFENGKESDIKWTDGSESKEEALKNLVCLVLEVANKELYSFNLDKKRKTKILNAIKILEDQNVFVR